MPAHCDSLSWGGSKIRESLSIFRNTSLKTLLCLHGNLVKRKKKGRHLKKERDRKERENINREEGEKEKEKKEKREKKKLTL